MQLNVDPIIIKKTMFKDSYSKTEQKAFHPNCSAEMLDYLNTEKYVATEEEITQFLQGDSERILRFQDGFFEAKQYKTMRKQLLADFVEQTHALDELTANIFENAS